jgi:hypothetical protein
MLADCQHANEYATQQNLIYAFKRTTNMLTSGNIKKLSKTMGFSESTLYHWISYRYRPNFKIFVHFLFCIDSNPISFLLDKDFQINTTLAKISERAKCFTNPKRPAIRNRKDIRKSLDEIISNNDTPKSISGAARLVGVSRQFLRHRFPNESRKIKENYNKHRREQRDARMAMLEEKVILAVKKATEAGIYPSAKRIFSKEFGISMNYHCTKFLMDVWRRAKANSGYQV